MPHHSPPTDRNQDRVSPINDNSNNNTTRKSRSKRNLVFAQMKNKCSNSGSLAHEKKSTTTTAATATTATSSRNSIIDRLQACLENEKIRDLELIGSDGIPVPALRCILGSASPVLERMLYGDFVESTNSIIEIKDDQGCSNRALQVLVEFCCSDQLNVPTDTKTTTTAAAAAAQTDRGTGVGVVPSMTSCKKNNPWSDCGNEVLVEDLMSLARLAHSYEIPTLQEAVQKYLMSRLNEDPSLACFVLNGSHPVSTAVLHSTALELIREHPYVTLKQNKEHATYGSRSGGMVCLFPENLDLILSDNDIEAEELFLFQCLVEWKDENANLYDNVTEICQAVTHRLNLACIDPNDLKSVVMASGIVSQEMLLDAFMEQALVASNKGIAFASFRGPRGPAGQQRGHAIVQGAGVKGCNGIYTQRKDTSNHPLLCYVKHDQRNNVTYYLIKDRTHAWKICENTTTLYEWKALGSQSSSAGGGRSKYEFDFPQTGWSLSSSAASAIELSLVKIKSPVPTCKFFCPRKVSGQKVGSTNVQFS